MELLADKNSNEMNSVTTFISRLDPITMLIMLPFMPAFVIMQCHMAMINQLSQASPMQQQQRTKVTSITRNGNTLDIIEKWV